MHCCCCLHLLYSSTFSFSLLFSFSTGLSFLFCRSLPGAKNPGNVGLQCSDKVGFVSRSDLSEEWDTQKWTLTLESWLCEFNERNESVKVKLVLHRQCSDEMETKESSLKRRWSSVSLPPLFVRLNMCRNRRLPFGKRIEEDSLLNSSKWDERSWRMRFIVGLGLQV